MKCIKNQATGVIKRVSDETADRAIRNGEWKFCPKAEWKLNNPIPRKSTSHQTGLIPANIN